MDAECDRRSFLMAGSIAGAGMILPGTASAALQSTSGMAQAITVSALAQAPAPTTDAAALRFAKRAIHLDCHTMPGMYDIAEDFNAEEFARTLSEAGVDYITVFAKCNLGFAYYPTQIGKVYPGLQIDLLGQMVAACHAKNIQVAAYFNTGIDHEHARLHREWCKVDKEGRVNKIAEMGHWFRDLCLNTGYGPHILGMVREVVERYPVDGIFLDCFDLGPCYGEECLSAMKKQGMNVFDNAQVGDFCQQVTYKFLEEVESLVATTRPSINILYNGLAYRRQPTHIELEVLPTGGWGYEYLPFAIRYARTLGKPYFTMTGRFHKSWGDFGGIRTKHSVLNDCFTSIANGGTCSVGDHLHPRARLEPAVYSLVGEAYKTVQPVEPWTIGARAEADIVVVEPHMREFPSPRAYQSGPEAFSMDSVKGAARLLSELKHQFDVSDGQEDISKYKVIVLADSVRITPDLKTKLEQHLSRGGAIISSGTAGMTEDGSAFALGAYSISFDGPEPNNPTFIEVLPPMADGIPPMLITNYQPGIALQAGPGAEVLARLYKPYSNLHAWDYEHETMYCPPEKDTGRPAAVRCGNVIHFSFPLFAGYLRDAVLAHRTLLANCLRLVLPEPTLQVSNFPSFGRVTVTARDGIRLVHLLNYVPELRGATMQMIEEPVAFDNVQVALRADGRETRKVYLAPQGEPVPFTQQGSYVNFTIPRVEGYQLAVVE